MIRARNSIHSKSKNSTNNINNLYKYTNTYLDNQHDATSAHYTHSSAESSNATSSTNSTVSLVDTQQPLERERFTGALKKPAADHHHRQLWRQSAVPQPSYVTPISGQKLAHYWKLQYPGATAQLPHKAAAMRAHELNRPTRDATFYANASVAEVLHTQQNQQQHQQQQQQLIPAAKSHSLAGSIRRIRRPRQWMPAPKRLVRASKQAHRMNLGILSKGHAFIIEFLQGSSIHGFIYLAKIGLSIVERMLWLAFICVALFAIISLSARTWERFQTSPMVISMDRNKLVWNTSFPSLTVCPHKRIDEFKVEEYMDSHPKTFESTQDRDDFHVFIEKLAHLNYENLESLPRNKTFDIPSSKYMDLLYELKWNFQPEISSGAAVQMFIYETLTEFGICHSVNSLVARYNSYDYWKQNDWSSLEHGDRVTVHPLDGEIYAQIINLSTAYDIYFHSSGDIPNISKQRYTFPESDYTTVELIALETYTAEEARAFTTKQRKCRYQYEAEDMQTSPIYSFGLCLAECRMFFALRACGCVPHFYRNQLKNGRVLRVCDFDGLACLEEIKKEIISLKSSRYKINCNCLSNCDDSNFFVQSYRTRNWVLGANLQWGIIDYPKMQLRRDVLFSFADVLVYIGGLIGFFLGCSALSVTEVIYYFTARLFKRMIWD